MEQETDDVLRNASHLLQLEGLLMHINNKMAC